MKKEEALQIITNVCEKFLGTKADHIAIEQALILIKKGLEEKEEKSDEKTTYKSDPAI